MSDLGDDFRALKEHRQAQNATRVMVFQNETKPLLEAQGYTVRSLGDTGTHFRVNEALDLFPVHRRFHYLGRKGRRAVRGGYSDAVKCCIQYLDRAENSGPRAS